MKCPHCHKLIPRPASQVAAEKRREATEARREYQRKWKKDHPKKRPPNASDLGPNPA